jgi:hypothetical protein
MNFQAAYRVPSLPDLDYAWQLPRSKSAANKKGRRDARWLLCLVYRAEILILWQTVLMLSHLWESACATTYHQGIIRSSLQKLYLAATKLPQVNGRSSV